MTIKFLKYPGRYEVVINKHPAGTLEMKEDGYYDWYPILLFNGYVPSWVLYAIANKLDDLNKD
jgi:hypothetical protein